MEQERCSNDGNDNRITYFLQQIHRDRPRACPYFYEKILAGEVYCLTMEHNAFKEYERVLALIGRGR